MADSKFKKINSKQELLIWPPQAKSKWNPESEVYEVDIPEIVPISVGVRDRWEIWFTNCAEGPLQLTYVKSEVGMEAAPVKMTVPIDEFLVTFALNALIANSKYHDCRRQNLITEATLLYTGRYELDAPRHVLYHPDGYLWFGWGEYNEALNKNDSSTHWCAKKPIVS